MPLKPWGFYGRRTELRQMQTVLSRERWFFLKLSGRRRIGKTSLIQEALQPHQRSKVLYLQVPDSDPAGVVSTARDFMQMFGVDTALPTTLRSLATRLGRLMEDAPVLDSHQRRAIEGHGYIPQDLEDLTTGLLPATETP